MGLIASAKSSVLVNGVPAFEFKYSKGIRQGDPISPFLFLIGMEAFTVMFKKAIAEGVFKGFEAPNGGPYVTCLLFADDSLIIGEWSDANADNMLRLLKCFNIISGLNINYQKSSLIGVGVNEVEVVSMANRMNCRVEKAPFLYLGLKVRANMNRIRNWQPVIDVFDARLASWKASSLSMGERLTILKSVLES
ncbi:uncharacterized mitochondrial protein AtMg01250-like [Helianthus annuus]|uniref:uncharacterized mitochondrial protein AtMg01250-like n=1 Tax=Helianthus annuus TaxID=4232 RepID=UPI000B8F92D4|nr:uncharacterized mitochondrial protein AtMg01250-like [Helianthus annuus]